MVAFAVDYGFETSLSPTTVAAGFSASAIATVGTATIEWRSNGRMRVTPRVTYDTSNQNGWEFTVGPEDPSQTWTPEILSLQALRVHSSTAQGFKVVDVATETTLFYFDGLTASMVTRTVDLTSLGEITGPRAFRVEMWAGTTSTYLEVDNVHVEGTYSPAGASDQTVEPVGIASSEAFGGAAVVVVQPVDLSPAGIASGEAFGAPVVVVLEPVPDQSVSPSSIASGEAFGGPTVTLQVAGTVPYPTGEDVAAFMATSDPQVVAVATVHVGVITQFALVYTRGNGFFVDGLAEPLAGVVLAATARLVGNPEQLDVQIGSVRRASFFKGWSLAEQRVLNHYRKVAS